MSDPRNAAHAKRVTQGKKHQATAVGSKDAAPVAPEDTPGLASPAGLDGSLVVLAKLKDLEFHSRANLERLAELTLTVDDELKQKSMVEPLGEVYAAQSAFQTKLTMLIDAYKTECDRLQGARA